jgi:hypothetical protein
LGLVCAVVFFFTPLAARAFGQQAVAFENHALAAFPHPTSWKFFSAFDTWSVDHLPLRQYAVRGDANLSQSVFGQPPQYGGGNADTGLPAGVGPKPATTPSDQPDPAYARVISGKDGWLFLGADASSACKPKRDMSDELALIDKLGRAVEASGRQFVFTVAPDKSTIEPDKLPSSFYGKECMTRQKNLFWDEARANPPTGFLDLRTPLEAQQKADGVPIYRQTDSHWAPRGSAVYAQQLADRLQPGLWDGTQVVSKGTGSGRGDLSIYAGLPTADHFQAWKVERPGIVVGYSGAPHPLAKPRTILNRPTSGSVRLFDQKTLLLGDSFTDAAATDLLPLFRQVTLLHNTSSLGYPDALNKAFVDNNVVVLEVVERSVIGGGIGLLGPKHLPDIMAALAAHPLRPH